MQISEQGLALIKTSEGFCANAYICPAGKNTIGYGHVILPGEIFADGISESDAESLLKQDVGTTETSVEHLVSIALLQNEFDALVAFAYNIGVGAFANSTLLKLLNSGDTASAANQFDRWVYADGKKLDGLVTRRAAEKRLFLSDIAGG